jgi:hypothetical protein
MLSMRILPALLAVLAAAAPSASLPELIVQATDGGSLLRVRNGAGQPVTAYLIEMVGYPGSSYTLYQESIGGDQPIAPGEERKIPITNMTVGAAPEYVKMQAAIFADGSTAGTPEKVSQLIGFRRTNLQTTRELIARLEKGAGAADLRGWAGSIPPQAKKDRGTPEALTRSATRDLISASADQLEKNSASDVLARLKATERALAGSKPAL